jgi:hypothetical protein
VQLFKVRDQDALTGLSNGRDYSYPARHVNANRFRADYVTTRMSLPSQHCRKCCTAGNLCLLANVPLLNITGEPARNLPQIHHLSVFIGFPLLSP